MTPPLRPWRKRNRHLLPKWWWVRHWRSAPWAFRAFVLPRLVERIRR